MPAERVESLGSLVVERDGFRSVDEVELHRAKGSVSVKPSVGGQRRTNLGSWEQRGGLPSARNLLCVSWSGRLTSLGMCRRLVDVQSTKVLQKGDEGLSQRRRETVDRAQGKTHRPPLLEPVKRLLPKLLISEGDNAPLGDLESDLVAPARIELMQLDPSNLATGRGNDVRDLDAGSLKDCSRVGELLGSVGGVDVGELFERREDARGRCDRRQEAGVLVLGLGRELLADEPERVRVVVGEGLGLSRSGHVGTRTERDGVKEGRERCLL